MALRKPYADPGPFFTVKQAAHHENVSEKTLRRAMAARKLAYFVDPIRISEQQLAEWRKRRVIDVQF